MHRNARFCLNRKVYNFTAFEAESMPLAFECFDLLGKVNGATAPWTTLGILYVDRL